MPDGTRARRATPRSPTKREGRAERSRRPSKPGLGNRATSRILAGAGVPPGAGRDLGNRAFSRMLDGETRSGAPLRAGIRGHMERAFETDFSGVRVIHGSRAARRMGAEAVTRGRHIHVAPGFGSTHTPKGRALLGHELAHVVQQRTGRVRATTQARGVGINQDRGLELEADRAGALAAQGRRARITGAGEGHAAGPLVAQCKVGLEFQAVGGGTGVWKWSGSRWVRPDHAEVISEEDGFRVETDFDDIEYVTDAFDERTIEGRGDIALAAARAARIHDKLTRLNTLTDGDLDVDAFEEQTGAYIVTAKSGTKYKLNKSGGQNAHPQATVGIRLDRLNAFTEAMGQKGDARSAHWRTLGFGGSTGTVGGSEERRDGQQDALADAAKRVRDQLEALSKGTMFLQHSTQSWKAVKSSDTFLVSKQAEGFLTLLVQYVRLTSYFASGRTQNAKNAWPIMARTSLNAIYKTLRAYEKKRISALMKLDNYKACRAYLFGAERLGDVTVASQRSGKVTLDQLWSDIQSGTHDRIHRFSGVSDLDTDTTGWEGKKARYGIDSPTDIGYGEKVAGVILEMRALGRNVPPNRWSAIATAVAEIARMQNT